MIREITKYVTEDGFEFDTRTDAENYVKEQMVLFKIQQFLDNSDIYFRDTSAYAIAEYIVEHLGEFKAIINDTN